MEFGVVEFGYGVGLVMLGWITGMGVSYIFKVARVIV